jgi:energy-coupling factor transporter ATP-binding protein EcfA2
MTNIISTNGTPLTTGDKVRAGGYVPLGTAGGKSVVLTNLDKRVVKLSASEMKEMNLMALLGADWCEAGFTDFDEKKEKLFFNYRRLATQIISDCQALGPYMDAYERKTGVWLMKDGNLVVNGRELWRADGTVLEHGIHDERVYPACGDVGFDRTTPAASDDEVNRALTAFGSLDWNHPLASELLLGWFGLALVSSAVRRRPHVLLTGPAGCGKSTILEEMKWLLGPLAFACTGPQTMAGYYQELGGTSRAAIVDEFEADPSKKGCKDTFEIARGSYSLQEGDSGIVRGTTTGVAKSYRFFSPFIAAGISPGKMEPADLTRWMTLEAKGRKPDAIQLTEAQAREIGPRLARRFTARWSVYQASEEIVRKCILDAGGDGRTADTVGTLLASYWTFVSDRPATADDAMVLVEMLDIKARIELHSVSDERRCLEALMSRVMPFKYMEGIAKVTRNLSLAEAIQKVCENPTDSADLLGRLAQMGLRVRPVQGVWRLMVVNSPEHQELRKLFAGTKWATGGWSVVLRRLPGGEESTQRMGPGFPAAKVTMFNLPQDLLPANDEGEMLMAA